MALVSPAFLIFLAAAVACYYLAPRKARWWVLLLASAVFYVYAGWGAFLVIAFDILAAWFAGRWMGREFERESAASAGASGAERRALRQKYRARRKICLSLFVLAALGALVATKYFNFFAEGGAQLLRWLGIPADAPRVDWVAPLGISYCTLSLLGYALDVFWGRLEPERNPLKLALFGLFFPAITIGPILRYGEMSERLFAARRYEPGTIRYSAQRMIWGYFKKLVIAENLAPLVEAVYGNWASWGALEIGAATVLYAFQFYADFSGCMDIVAGASEMFGIALPANFRHPFFARSVPDFWRRWHITLGAFFKDYVFYPLSASRGMLALGRAAKKRLGYAASREITAFAGLLCVWFLIGLWHGPHLKYAVTGLYFGIVIVITMKVSPACANLLRRMRVDPESRPIALLQMLLTFLLGCVSRVLFRADGVAQALGILGRIVRFAPGPNSLPLLSYFDVSLKNWRSFAGVAGIFVLLAVEWIEERGALRERLEKRGTLIKWCAAYACLLAILLLGNFGLGAATTFIYERF